MTLVPADVRAAITARLGVIPELDTRDYLPDAITPPVAISWPQSVNFDETMGRGVDIYMFSVSVLIDRADSETAQANLDAYLDASGTYSVKAALEGRSSSAYEFRTLDGVVQTCRVESIAIGTAEIGLVGYLYAEFTLMVAG